MRAARLVRRYQPNKRVARCMERVKWKVEVSIREDSVGKPLAHFHGVGYCGSVWACPRCRYAICSARAKEVTKAVETHGAERVLMLSLTIRHRVGMPLADLKDALTNGYRRFARGKPWKRFGERVGLLGSVRAVEVTHGPNGWHPHIHAMFFTDRGLAEDDVAWLRARWQRCVARENEVAEPDAEHGLVVTPCHSAKYLEKLGLETVDPLSSKVGSEGHRSAMRLCADLGEHHDEGDAKLWSEYCDTMYGARQLCWSHGLRESLGLDEEFTDQELVEAKDDEKGGDVIVLDLDPETYDALHRNGNEALLLEAAERGVPGKELYVLAQQLALVDAPDRVPESRRFSFKKRRKGCRKVKQKGGDFGGAERGS